MVKILQKIRSIPCSLHNTTITISMDCCIFESCSHKWLWAGASKRHEHQERPDDSCDARLAVKGTLLLCPHAGELSNTVYFSRVSYPLRKLRQPRAQEANRYCFDS
jgi:hypothetical protein